ncbi:hypothetical protein [Stenotrophomonas sp.]|uniref:M949_RS01915 family surface polysaccharide biosynthesis protein n=1 Tax=Stenotrophomonas sp. TaxID=69392 RepID=UPI002FC6EA5A
MPFPLPRPPLRHACLPLLAALLGACGAPPAPPPPPAAAPAAIATLAPSSTSSPATVAVFERLPDPSVAQAQAWGVGAALHYVHFRDREGEGLLALTQEDREEADPDNPDQAMPVAVLTATLHRRSGGGAFQRRWTEQVRTPCPDLDLDAGWYAGQSGATDLDGDGHAEITLASHRFCGGGVDPQQIRITFIAGTQRYGIEGESLVAFEGEAPFGGERQDDAALATAPAPFRRHLDAVWNAVRVMPAGAEAPVP